MYMLNGCGTTLYGRTKIPGESAKIATECICIFWIPLIPLRSYLILSDSGTDPIDLFFWGSKREYQLVPLGYIYKPHLKVYFFYVAFIILGLIYQLLN